MDRLSNGLTKLYEDYANFGVRNLNFDNFFNNDNLSFGSWHKLPLISNSNFDNIPIESLNMDLGEHVKFMDLQIFHVLPSSFLLSIHAYFDENASKELNAIIQKNHETKILYHKFPETIPDNQKYISYTTSSHFDPESVKTDEITEFRLCVKKEVVDFFLNFDLKGLFFKSFLKDISIIPSIEFFSLDLPSDEKNLIKWGRENNGFLHCFHTYLHPNNCYKLDDDKNSYLFFAENNTKNKFSNYFIFKSSKNDENDDLIFDYENKFEFLVFSRWLQIHKKRVAEFSNIISKEIENLRKNKLQDVLKTRKKIYKGIFYFERFKTEYKLKDFQQTGFKLIGNKNIDLNASRMEYIKQDIEIIDGIINTFNKHFDVILGLKNIEYSEKMQNKVYRLTLIVIFLAIIQLIFALNQINFNLLDFLKFWGF